MNKWQVLGRAREAKASVIKQLGIRKMWSAEEICRIVGAELPQFGDIKPDKQFSMICCFDGAFLKDSLFVQYERERISVAKTAMKRGAAALLSAEQIEEYPCIIVPDVLTALQQLCEAMYEEINIPATVVTGSVGKTSTKNFLNCVYSSQTRTFCNSTNGNTLEYLGFELQRFDRKAKLFIQEVNESDPHNASNCSKALHPHIALITNMDRSHIGELGSEENIIKAISEITDGMSRNDYVIINGDDANSAKASFSQKVIRVAIHNQDADCLAHDIQMSDGKTAFTLEYNNERVNVEIPVLGEHNVYNACMAFVAGKISGISTKNILKGLKKYQPMGFRQNTYSVGKVTVYADCYNSSAKSVGSAISVMNSLKRKPGDCKIAVLGDIAEIEGFEEDTYCSIADTLRSSDVDVLFAYGKDSVMILDYLTDSTINCYHTANKQELEQMIRTEVDKHDAVTVLFKGSRTMHLEKVIKDVFPMAYYKGMLPVWVAYSIWTIKTL